MAERKVPGPTARHIPLVIDQGVIEQQPYKEAGLKPVNFGAGSRTNTIPPGPAEQAMLGRRNLQTNLGRQFELIKQNTMALMSHADRSGNLHTWSKFYDDANQFADELATKYPHLTLRQASGVTASLSGGGGEWERNKLNAEKLADFASRGFTPEVKDLAGVEASRINNGMRIFHGEDPASVLGDLKERNFMENINDPQGDHVTVDTQMYHGQTAWKRPWRGIGGGTPGLQHSRVYHFLASAVKSAASEYGLSPAQGQAAGWYANKDISGGLWGSAPPHHPAFNEVFPSVKPGKKYRSQEND